MTRLLEIPFDGDAALKLQAVKLAAMKAGVEFTGNQRCGVFVGKGIDGDYIIMPGHVNMINIVIIKKPFFMSWKTIENKIKEFIEA